MGCIASEPLEVLRIGPKVRNAGFNHSEPWFHQPSALQMSDWIGWGLCDILQSIRNHSLKLEIEYG